MMKSTERPGTLLVETNGFDVFLGRGKNANNRPGNTRFRKLVLELFEAYQNTDCGGEKTKLAMKLVFQVQAKGGRFIRSVAAANSSGQQVSAWEVVGDDVALAKVKQAIRDVATGRKRKAKKEHLEQRVACNEEHKAPEVLSHVQQSSTTWQQAPTQSQLHQRQQQSLIDSFQQTLQHQFAVPSNAIMNYMQPEQPQSYSSNLINPQLLPAAMASMAWPEANPHSRVSDVVPMLHRIQQLERSRQERQLLEMIYAQRTPQVGTGLRRSVGNQSDGTPGSSVQHRQAGAPNHRTFSVSDSFAGNVVDPVGSGNPSVRTEGYDQHRMEPSAQELQSAAGSSMPQHENQSSLIPTHPAGLPSSQSIVVSSQGVPDNPQVFPITEDTKTTKANTQRAVEPSSQPPRSAQRNGGPKQERKRGDGKSDTPI